MVILLLRFMSIEAKTSTFEFVSETQKEEHKFLAGRVDYTFGLYDWASIVRILYIFLLPNAHARIFSAHYFSRVSDWLNLNLCLLWFDLMHKRASLEYMYYQKFSTAHFY